MTEPRPEWRCPTCGIERRYDGPEYRRALKQAGKPMCPDPFHVPKHETPDTPSTEERGKPEPVEREKLIALAQDKGMCGEPSPDGLNLCAFPLDHDGRHGWEPEPVEREEGETFYVCPECGWSSGTDLRPCEAVAHFARAVECEPVQFVRASDLAEAQAWAKRHKHDAEHFQKEAVEAQDRARRAEVERIAARSELHKATANRCDNCCGWCAGHSQAPCTCADGAALHEAREAMTRVLDAIFVDGGIGEAEAAVAEITRIAGRWAARNEDAARIVTPAYGIKYLLADIRDAAESARSALSSTDPKEGA